MFIITKPYTIYYSKTSASLKLFIIFIFRNPKPILLSSKIESLFLFLLEEIFFNVIFFSVETLFIESNDIENADATEENLKLESPFSSLSEIDVVTTFSNKVVFIAVSVVSSPQSISSSGGARSPRSSLEALASSRRIIISSFLPDTTKDLFCKSSLSAGILRDL
ncbi:unnamed protein product [Pneumocystis jirovecii]|uniref:Uncharacterized protein n=1 Tax=Pneumocystis jirovecii TaxID=42068 RepID=L0PAD0_PNEJI|nr:unnamed protein product [Pneumocystis jirovecii]